MKWIRTISIHFCAIFMLLALGAASPATALQITLTPDYANNPSTYGDLAQDLDQSPSFTSETLEITPALGQQFQTVHVQSTPGGFSSAQQSISLDDTGFYFNIMQSRASSAGSVARSTGDIFFTVDQDVDFAISGSYYASALATAPLSFSVILNEVSGSTLFQNTQENATTSGGSFVLGEQGGDVNNILSGSLTGTLLAGVQYRFHYFTQTGGDVAAAGVASQAFGDIAMTFVPEPGVLSLWAGAGAALALARRRRRA